jgi:hypothetical protein
VLSAGGGPPARTPFGFLVRPLPVVVTVTECLTRCLSPIDVGVVRLDGAGDISVEVLFPEVRGNLELVSSGWPWVLGVDAAGGPPHRYVADECGVRVASRRSPDWLIIGSGCEVSNLVGEVGDVLGSLCQVGPPDGMGMKRWWNAREPGQRTLVGRRECWEAPVELGRHVACGREILTSGGFL